MPFTLMELNLLSVYVKAVQFLLLNFLNVYVKAVEFLRTLESMIRLLVI